MSTTPAWSVPEVLWRPARPGTAPMDDYRLHLNRTFHLTLRTTADIHRFSVRRPHQFWPDLYTYLGLRPPLPPSLTKAYDDTVPMSSLPAFFPGLHLNYAENALFSNPDPDAVALIGIREGQDVYGDAGETLTWGQFREKVRLTASALRRSGVNQGDRVAALVATSIWAMVLFHAGATIGAIFTCINPDLGLEGCVSRLRQVIPTILFADSHAIYKGKTVSVLSKLQGIISRLDPRPPLFVIPIVEEPCEFPPIDNFLAKAVQSDPLTFNRVAFHYPLMICYSSGTTGAPKCIVHQHGCILQYKKISVLHNSLTPKDVIMQYSSTSWVVFYVMCGHFSLGTTVVCYNGSPLYPDAKQLMRICDKYKVTFFGASPRYLLELEMSKTIPKAEFDLSSLRMVYTTGATLSVEQYRWFYRSFPPSVQISNTAGGTDTATSLISVDPTGPLYAGEMQVCALGMDVDIAHPETGESIAHTGEPGELVLRQPFPSMPCFFWGDDGGKIYRSAYFERFETVDVWAQHDWISRNPHTGGFVMHGRSDGVLNPSGIRFGSGEIYAIVEAARFNDTVSNTLCVGRRRKQDADEQVFLFVVMKPGTTLSPALRNEIKLAIRTGLSARHVPRFVLQVPEIPTTINGKKVEAAIKRIISGADVEPSATVANPDCFRYFTRFRQIDSEPAEAKL